jgi:hypothetical protein
MSILMLKPTHPMWIALVLLFPAPAPAGESAGAAPAGPFVSDWPGYLGPCGNFTERKDRAK